MRDSKDDYTNIATDLQKMVESTLPKTLIK